MRRFKHAIAVIVLIAVSTVGLYFLFDALFARPTAASAEAGPIDVMFGAHFWMMALLFSMIMVIVLYSAIVFRRRPGDEEDGPHIHGHTGLEILWTVVPTLTVIGFGVYGAVVLGDLVAAKPGEMVIQATGRQWGWSFGYPEREDVSSATLVLAVDQPVVMELHAEDVLHSFWVPEFRVKQDLVPGSVHYLRFTPTRIGDYKLRCAEICGTGHANMEAPVRVVALDEFEQWAIDAQFRYADLTPEERGQRWYAVEFGCNACHSIDGSPGVGPSWQGIYGHEASLADGSTATVDDAYISSAILNPNAQIVAGFNPGIMPQDYESRFNTKQAEILQSEGANIDIVSDMIAYIKTLQP